MVKYRSRINASNRKKKMSTTGDEPSQTILNPDVNTSRADNIEPEGAALSTGGALDKSKVLKVVKKVVEAIPKIKAAVQGKFGAALPSGGALSTGGILNSEDIDNLSWDDMIHTLGAMDLPTYHMLQGLAHAYLGSTHPLAGPIKAAYGGSFVHPKNISKLATKDIIRAINPLVLSRALHSEKLDMMAGKDVGGGLFTSLKMLVKKGVSGAKKALLSVASGAKSAVRALSAGAKVTGMIGTSLSNALKQGVEIANVLQPAVSQLSPAAGELIGRGLTAAERAQEIVKQGIDISGQVSTGLDPIIAALGPVNAPLVSPQLIAGSEPEFVA